MELGGILVYDAYAFINGQASIMDYYSQNPNIIVNPNILFSKEQVDQKIAALYSYVPRERDFATELDK